MIKITNLNKYFYRKKSNEIHVINDMTLEFPDTGLVTIFGESGSGKTTLMNLIGGLDKFDSGYIEYDDKQVSKYRPHTMDKIRNEKIGYIFQNYLLLQQRTVYENLKILLNMYNITEEEKNERIDYVLNSVGMLKYKKKSVSELSGGQQQRVAIARALIKSPSVILADEPTGNLDEKNTIQIMNIIKKISKNVLVILVSHEKRIAKSYSDYIVEVSDGKIDKTYNVSHNNTYEYEDDQNIYLKEYNYTNINNDQVNLDFYSNDNEKINLQIIYENGRFYIKSSNDVIFLDNKSEIQLIDDHKQKLDAIKEVSENNYELSPLKFVKQPSLSFKEIIKIAIQNLGKMKKRTLFLAFPLIVIIVLVLFSVNSVISASQVDYQGIAKRDSHIYSIELDKGYSQMNTELSRFGFMKFYEDFSEKNPNIEPVLHYNTVLYYNLPNFNQLDSNRYEITGFSFISIDKVNEEQLIYGRMPKDASEIVVSKWVLENALKDSTSSNFMDVSSFVNKVVAVANKEVSLQDKNSTLKIVGIVDSQENSIYINNWMVLNIYPSYIKKMGIRLCSYTDLKNYLGELEYESNSIICNSDSSNVYLGKTVDIDGYFEYTINQTISFNGYPFDLALPDDQYENILKYVLMVNYDQFDVYCDNEEEQQQVIKYLDEVKDYYASGELIANEENGYTSGKLDFDEVKFIIYSSNKYDEIMKPYEEEALKSVLSRVLITFTIIIISIIIVFFSMKSFAIKNIYDIGVYRAIGIKKSSIALIYAIEVLIISLMTTFVGGTLCYFITNFIAGIPLLGSNISISFGLYAVSTFSLIVLNVVVGVWPVMRYMRLTPSQLLTKYDI